MEPSLDRIRAFVELLGDPQQNYPVIHLTGTNGKTSTARMIDTLLRALELRTGRFTSPHVERMTERIGLDGEQLSDEEFVRAFNDVAPYIQLVDADQPYPLSFFETVVAMAYAAFADAPVDVAVVEVGLGGTWDATNVADAAVAVVLPIAIDHAHLLGDDPVTIAGEKAGIIKPDSIAVIAQQQPDVEEVLRNRANDVGARLLRENVDFGVINRTPAVGGQLLSLQGLRARYDDLFLPLYGAHQAQNAVMALVAVEAFLGTEPLDGELVAAAFAAVTSPGRLEVVRRSPTILLDAAHNPHGAEATAAALEDSFQLDPLVGVIGVMGDKDFEGLLAAFEPHLAHVVITQNSTARALKAEQLAVTAREVFGEDRVTVEPNLPDAIDRAVAIAEENSSGSSVGAGAVLVTGSVVTVGEARRLLVKGPR
ncbi:MAG: folylpolyglutamate synthase/dihydrofolate synthase family protein [Nocardioides sp.]